MHPVPQNKEEIMINSLFNCFEALIFTQPLVYEFLCGLKHMATPVLQRLAFTLVAGCACAAAAICKRQEVRKQPSPILLSELNTL